MANINKNVGSNSPNMLFLITNEDNIHLCCEQYIKLAKKVLAVHSEMGEPIEKNTSA